jgi:hypothetical protein
VDIETGERVETELDGLIRWRHDQRVLSEGERLEGELWRGYELQNERLVGSYLEKYPDECPKWDAFMDAAQEHNTLETLGVSGATGVPEPDRPRELGYTAAASVGVGGEGSEL